VSNSPIRWLGGDIQIDDRRFCHGDNGVQEFYETVIASQGVLLGILRNHGEEIWIAYVTQAQAVRTLTGCARRSDGNLDAEPLYGTKNDPQSLAEGLIRLWREHGERVLSLPCAVIAKQGERCA
jgi:hypothetical protein